MEEIREKKTGKEGYTIQEEKTNQYKPLENIPEQNSLKDTVKVSKRNLRIILSAVAMVTAGFIGMVVMSTSSSTRAVDKSPNAQEVLETHTSMTLPPGTRLLDKDENYIGGDLTITHSSQEDETSLYIWDYAAEDGDYVEVFIDGVSLGDPFMIKNKPVIYTIPAECEVKVVGTRDGGGGITYAVYYGVTKTTYLNGMTQGNDNVYTLIKE